MTSQLPNPILSPFVQRNLHEWVPRIRGLRMSVTFLYIEKELADVILVRG